MIGAAHKHAIESEIESKAGLRYSPRLRARPRKRSAELLLTGLNPRRQGKHPDL